MGVVQACTNDYIILLKLLLHNYAHDRGPNRNQLFTPAALNQSKPTFISTNNV